jgi:hypothetical protein
VEIVKSKPVEATKRTLIQNAKYAVCDVYDAIVELVTNSDDRYQLLGMPGRIEIEVERHRKEEPNILRIRDFADGMTAADMERKLSYEGERVSGMENGKDVRGTNSRGAKDVAALGKVSFQSIATDGKFHECEITPHLDFNLGPSRVPSAKLRKEVGIPEGTGMLVTVEVETLPQHESLRKRVSQLVSLRDILSNPDRTIVLRDLNREREDRLAAPTIEGHDRIKETFEVPGYPGITAKLVIKRAKERFELSSDRFRLGGILVKSRHAIHEATYFDTRLENDPHALWFYGKITCPYIDDLSSECDDRIDAGLQPRPENPVPIVDPNRKSGLTKKHPFVEVLFRESLRRLRPLVEEERQREEHERASIESATTRKRLNALEAAASKFMEEFAEEDEPARDPDSIDASKSFRERGFALNPPFCQMVQGQSQRFWLNISQKAYPEFEVGATVQVECLSNHIQADRQFCGLEPHPSQEGILRAFWSVQAKLPTPATGLRVRVGQINVESVIEVFATEADRYVDITDLCFAKKRYTVRTNSKRKRVRILAPLALVSTPQRLDLSSSDPAFTFSGDPTIYPRSELGVSICEVFVNAGTSQASARLSATLGQRQASAEIRSVEQKGTGIKIKLEGIDLGNQRYRWRQNVLEIAAEHPSLHRYLGPKAENFPGQEAKHFRILLAEIVADAVCTRLVSRNVELCPEDFQGADWDTYYAQFDKLRTKFLPIAHRLQIPDLA